MDEWRCAGCEQWLSFDEEVCPNCGCEDVMETRINLGDGDEGKHLPRPPPWASDPTEAYREACIEATRAANKR